MVACLSARPTLAICIREGDKKRPGFWQAASKLEDETEAARRRSRPAGEEQETEGEPHAPTTPGVLVPSVSVMVAAQKSKR